MAGKKGALRLPAMTTEQMAAVDAIVLEALHRPGNRTRGLVRNAIAGKLRMMLEAKRLPHGNFDRIVSQSLQRLRARGAIYTAGGGNAVWLIGRSA